MKIKVTIPESLEDIKAADYARFMLAEPTEEKIPELSLTFFVGISDTDRKRINKPVIDDITRQVLEVLNEKPNLQRFITIDGVEYGFVPDLENITLAEFVDAEEYFKNPYQNWQKILGVLYRPITSKVFNKFYDVEVYNPDKHNGEVFKDASAALLQGCMLFFWRLEIKLVADTLTSSQEQKKKGKALQVQGKDLEESGDGMRHSIALLQEIYSNSKG